MFKNILLLAICILTFSNISAQEEIAYEKPCEKYCTIERTIQEGTLLGVEITNYQQNTGAYVINVLDNTAAAKYALRKGDVITKVNEHLITGMQNLVKTIDSYNASDIVNITFIRVDEIRNVDVILGAESTKIITESICCDLIPTALTENNVSLYPNPTVNSINLTIGNLQEDKYSVQIFNMEGKRLYNSVINQSGTIETSINVESFPSGKYFIKISNDKEQYTKTFIKED